MDQEKNIRADNDIMYTYFCNFINGARFLVINMSKEEPTGCRFGPMQVNTGDHALREG